MHLSFAPSAHHVVAHAVRSKRNGAPLSQIARRQPRLLLPAAVVPFARAARGSDPIQPASQSVSLERLRQASAASPSRKAFVSCLIQNSWHDGNKKACFTSQFSPSCGVSVTSPRLNEIHRTPPDANNRLILVKQPLRIHHLISATRAPLANPIYAKSISARPRHRVSASPPQTDVIG